MIRIFSRISFGRASVLSIGALALLAVTEVIGTEAAAQQSLAAHTVLPSSEAATRGDPAPAQSPAASALTPAQPASLAELVAQQPVDIQLSPELHCMATAIYFEAGGEPLVGQLAVGRVVVARSKSGRFPGSYCGVVKQHSQFSFVRHGEMPSTNHACAHWRNAVAIAQIADSGSWSSPVEGALFFHAAWIAPHWRLQRIARIDNHIFYR